MSVRAGQSATRKPKNTLVLGIVAGLLALCCGGTAIAAAVGGGKPKNSTPATSATATPVETASQSPTPEPAPAAPTAATLPARPAATTVAPRPAATTRQQPPAQATKPAYQQGVHPGAFCSPRGAYGYTSTGVLMQCKPSATDSRNRWRAA